MVRVPARYGMLLLAGYGLLVLTLMLWPFRLDIGCVLCANGVAWDEAGLVLRQPGLLRTPQPPADLGARLIEGDGLTVEAVVTPETLEQGGPARIVSYSRGPGRRNFTLGQEGDAVVFRLRTSETDPNGLSFEVAAPDSLQAGRRHHVAVTFDFSELRIYVDGRLRRRAASPGGQFSAWSRAQVLLVGNELGGRRPWQGRIESVAIHDRSLSAAELAERASSRGRLDGPVAYDFSAGPSAGVRDRGTLHLGVDLAQPAVFANISDRALLSEEPRRPSDIGTSFVLFYPLGVFAALGIGRLRGRPAAALLVAALFVLLAESLQFFVASRTSSLIDLSAGLAGCACGVLTATRLRPGLRD
jgi:VanZ family protein